MQNSEILQHSYARYISFDVFHCNQLVYWLMWAAQVWEQRRAQEDWAGNMCHCWMQPSFSRGPFLCKCLLLLLTFILCVIKLWDEWLQWCGGGRWHSFPTMVSHPMSCTSVLPLSPRGLSATPLSRELPSQLLLFFWECWALSACLERILMPGKDDSVRESSSCYLIPQEKGLGQHKVLNGISEAIDPM